MINGATLQNLIRLDIDDYNKTKYSDYQLLNAINMALRYITQSKVLEASDFMIASKSYTQNGALPEDFLNLIEVVDSNEYTLQPCVVTKTPKAYEYKIIGEQIYCGATSWTMFYKKYLLPVTSVTSNINLPDFCTNLIVKAVGAILTQPDPNVIAKAIDDIIIKDIPLRKYNKKKTVIGGGEA